MYENGDYDDEDGDCRVLSHVMIVNNGNGNYNFWMVVQAMRW